MLRHLKFDYTVIISLLGKENGMNFFYNKKNQRIIAGVIAGLLILAMVVTTVFSV